MLSASEILFYMFMFMTLIFVTFLFSGWAIAYWNSSRIKTRRMWVAISIAALLGYSIAFIAIGILIYSVYSGYMILGA